MPVCQILESPHASIQDLEQRLPRLRESRSFEGIEGERTDRVLSVEAHSDPDGHRVVFLHHELRIIPLGEDGGEQRFVMPRRVEILITPHRRKTLWFVHGQRADANATARFFGLKLFNSVDAILNLDIPPRVLADLEQRDADDVRAAKFRDVDAQVKEAGLRGSLTRSRHLRDLKREGTWSDITFASSSTGRRVRVATWGLVSMMGRGVTRPNLERYILEEILPRVRG